VSLLEDYLDSFSQLCRRLDSIYSDAATPIDSAPLVLEVPGFAQTKAPGSDAQCVVLGLLVHGNEFGPLAAVVPWLTGIVSAFESAFQSPFADTIVVFVANARAGLAGKRFMDADLNRLFARNADAALDGHEGMLVPKLQRILSRPELALFVDLHQTIEPTERAFFTFGYHQPSVRWARALAPGVADTLVTRAPGVSFVQGQLSSDEFVRNRGLPGITVELGQKGFNKETEERTHALSTNLENALRHRFWRDNPSDMPQAPIRYLATRHRIAFDGPSAALAAGLTNFTQCEAGQVLGSDHSGNRLIAPASGYLLFPKYPERDDRNFAKFPLPGDIVNIAAELPDAELRSWESAKS
jgi:succinylglutamate desuccinylase